MKLKIRTYTPVHIGTGEELVSLDYVIDENKRYYYRISQDQFADFLYEKARDKVKVYAEWVKDIAAEIGDLKENRRAKLKEMDNNRRDYNQKLSALQQSMNLMDFCKEHNLVKAFKAYYEKEAEAGRVRRLKIRSKIGDKKLQVRGMMCTHEGKPYIPGTTLKGSVRTALLYKALQEYGEPYEIELMEAISQELARNQRATRTAVKIGPELEYSMAYGGTRKKKGGYVSYDDVQQDVFKFLVISDAHLEKAADYKEKTEVVKTDLYLHTNTSTDRKRPKFRASRQPQSPYIEALGTGLEFSFGLHFKLKELHAIYQVVRHTPEQDRLNWVGLEKKVLQVFGIDLKSLEEKDLDQETEKVENFIFKTIREFSKAQAEFETHWLKKIFLKDQLDEILARFYREETFEKAFGITGRYPHGKRTLMRIGYGGGFPNKTAFLYFLKNGNLKESLKNAMRQLEIGNRPGSKGRYEPNPDRFPKSRTLISYKKEVAQLGWLEIGRPEDWSQDQAMVYEQISLASEPEKAEPAKPEFQTQKIKKGDFIDGVFLKKGFGPKQKIFELYLNDGKKMEASTNYFSDLEEGKVYNIQVNAVDKKGKVVSFIVRGLK